MPRYKVEVKRVVSFIVCVEVDCEENEIEEKNRWELWVSKNW